MSLVFADTSYYLALLNPADESHKRAIGFTATFAGTMVTTDWVLTELADGLSRARTRRILIDFVESLRGDPAVRIVPASRRLLQRGWDLYRRRPDQEWTLTDCTSFVVMRQMRLTEALTADHHFEQAGFHAQLKR
jgi:predicted nucleic acid-binding protein